MIELVNVTKHYPGADRAAVQDFSITIPAGEVVVLIGPSGCGKSTTLRMINALVVPDSGRVLLDGVDVLTVPPQELRRGIGYAIQGVGLFPHWTVHENIGTVPWLKGWDAERVTARVRELLELVGLDPDRYASEYPDELSGGEAQRVGVARALAADPPVLLMDEPFGAVDPLTRDRLQREFMTIQARLKKTVVFVTHDIDEAVRIGDRIAIMRDGRLVQYDLPERVLAYPADDFVADFVGGERALKRLSLARLQGVMQPAEGPANDVPAVGQDATLREALSRILESGEDVIAVVDEAGVVVGRVSIEDLLGHFKRPVP
ncbi:MAG: glycine/betaine ABC transporter [Actinobacteria bacterium HGW-Actinobacteria-10]|nr:MAG: glycine/betaine ABC transporter [Actinobacteria bacterium HGW-Actinobacteria-10]